MGTTYKIKPEITNLILERKNKNPNLSCRQISYLLEHEFKIKLSKSSINAILKKSALSMPIGRRQKKAKMQPEAQKPPETPAEVQKPPETPAEVPAAPEKPVELPEGVVEIPKEVAETKAEALVEGQTSGAILLKAADYLIGGTRQLSENIKSHLAIKENDFLAKIEGLVYLPLFETNPLELWSLLGKKLDPDNLNVFLNELEQNKTIGLEMRRVLLNSLPEVHYLKVDLSDTESLYLDGQFYTIWSTQYLPYDFGAPIYNIKKYIKTRCSEQGFFILFMAPGYTTPTNEFFNFIRELQAEEKMISKFTFYGNKFQELDCMPLEKNKKYYLIFGLWPWQFSDYRNVKKIGEFKPFYFEPQKKEFYLADMELELLMPATNKPFALRGCALKTSLSEKVRLAILSNVFSETIKTEELANIYLGRWPNLEETFQDFSRKVELFTYTATSQQFFSVEQLELESFSEIKQLFEGYLKALDLYVRWHFLPAGYETQDFSVIKDRFYNLKVNLKKEKDYALATFELPAGFSFLKDLEYACRRLNEREIEFSDGVRLWFSP